MVYIRHLRGWKYPVERLLSEAGVTGYNSMDRAWTLRPGTIGRRMV